MTVAVADFTLDGENNVLLTVVGDFSLVEAIEFCTLEGGFSLSRPDFTSDYKDDTTVFSFQCPDAIILDVLFSFGGDHSDGLPVLASLFPTDDEEYSKIFRSRPSRPDNIYLNFFVARQIATAFPGRPCFKISGAIVEAYKAVELCDKKFIAAADKRLESLYPLLAQCEYATSPRVNKEHLEFSMLCVHFHLKIMLSDFDGLTQVLKRVYSGVRGVAVFYTPSFPISLALLLYAVIAKLKGNEALFTKILTKMEFVFKRAVYDSSIENARWFKELHIAHGAVGNALMLRDDFISAIESERLIKDVFYKSIRVKGKSAHLMYKKFTSFFDVYAREKN